MGKHAKPSKTSATNEADMNDVTEGFAVFKSMPKERFRFRVEKQQQQQQDTDNHCKIWLENKSSKKQWECEVKNIADFAPEGIAIPLETVLGYVTSCLKATTAAAAANTSFDADLVKNSKQSGEFVLEVTFRFAISDFSWSPTFKFPMRSVEVQEIDILRSQLQDQREDLDSLRSQVQEQCAELQQLKKSVAHLESRKGNYPYN